VEKVRVDRSVLVGLATLAAVSLLAVAFLLGRASGPSAPQAPAPTAHAESVAPEAAPPAPAPIPGLTPFASAPEPVRPAEPSVVPAAPVVAPPPPAAPDPAPPTAGPVPAPEVPGAAAVAAYFAALDAIGPSGPAGDPQSLAGGLATALAQGDTSGIDGLIRETEESRARLLAIAPPAACAAHHRETLASLDDALGMLRALKAATGSDDPATALADVATRSTALKSRAEALQAEERALRERYGLAR